MPLEIFRTHENELQQAAIRSAVLAPRRRTLGGRCSSSRRGCDQRSVAQGAKHIGSSLGDADRAELLAHTDPDPARGIEFKLLKSRHETESRQRVLDGAGSSGLTRECLRIGLGLRSGLVRAEEPL